MTHTQLDPLLRTPLTDRNRLLSTLAMVGSAACWGSATTMSKSALADFPPLTLLVVQLVASVSFLWIVVWLTRPKLQADRAFLVASLAGILEPGLAYAVGLAGLTLTTASNASLLFAAEPLLIVLLAWVLLRSPPSWALIGWIVVAGIGVVLVTAPDAGMTAGALTGDLLILLGTALAALYVVVSSQMVLARPAIVLAAGQQSAGLASAVLILAAALATGVEQVDLTGFTAASLAFAGASGIIQYALAFWLYLLGLKHLSAREAGLWLGLIPVFGIATAVAFLHEVPTLAMLLGAAIIISAVVGARRSGHA
jgi:drug/metabolite transporter (DMT)-like permease